MRTTTPPAPQLRLRNGPPEVCLRRHALSQRGRLCLCHQADLVDAPPRLWCSSAELPSSGPTVTCLACCEPSLLPRAAAAGSPVRCRSSRPLLHLCLYDPEEDWAAGTRTMTPMWSLLLLQLRSLFDLPGSRCRPVSAH